MSRIGLRHQAINSRKVARPLGPYAHAVCVQQTGAMLFVSGQLPVDSKGRVFTGDFQQQTNMCLTAMRAILADAGFALVEVTQVTVYLVDMNHLPILEAAYQQTFRGQIQPARNLVVVSGLLGQAGVMIGAIACKPAEAAPAAENPPSGENNDEDLDY